MTTWLDRILKETLPVKPRGSEVIHKFEGAELNRVFKIDENVRFEGDLTITRIQNFRYLDSGKRTETLYKINWDIGYNTIYEYRIAVLTFTNEADVIQQLHLLMTIRYGKN